MFLAVEVQLNRGVSLRVEDEEVLGGVYHIWGVSVLQVVLCPLRTISTSVVARAAIGARGLTPPFDKGPKRAKQGPIPPNGVEPVARSSPASALCPTSRRRAKERVNRLFTKAI